MDNIDFNVPYLNAGLTTGQASHKAIIDRGERFLRDGYDIENNPGIEGDSLISAIIANYDDEKEINEALKNAGFTIKVRIMQFSTHKIAKWAMDICMASRGFKTRKGQPVMIV